MQCPFLLHRVVTGACMLGMLALLSVLSGCAGFGQCGMRECPEDARITGEVRALLAESPALAAPNSISIQTVDGVVYLRGLVSTPYQIAAAGSIAGRAHGITSVQNLLYIDNSH